MWLESHKRAIAVDLAPLNIITSAAKRNVVGISRECE